MKKKERNPRGSHNIHLCQIIWDRHDEKFSLYSGQNEIFECKIKMTQGNVNNNVFYVDINKYPII